MRANLGVEFGQPLRPLAGRRLIGRDDDALDARQVVQRLQRDDHLDRRAVRVGDDALGMFCSASALTSGTTSGTSGSMRQALELSMTMAPAFAAIGLDLAADRRRRAGQHDLDAGERFGADRLDGVRFTLELDGFAGAALGREELDAAKGKLCSASTCRMISPTAPVAPDDRNAD